MIDLILLFFVLGVYYGGFWCGKTFGTLSAMVDALKSKF